MAEAETPRLLTRLHHRPVGDQLPPLRQRFHSGDRAPANAVGRFIQSDSTYGNSVPQRFSRSYLRGDNHINSVKRRRAEGVARSNVGDRPNHQGGFFHAAEFCFATAMRLVPRRYRFADALLIARAAMPLFSMTYPYRERGRLGFDET